MTTDVDLDAIEARWSGDHGWCIEIRSLVAASRADRIQNRELRAALKDVLPFVGYPATIMTDSEHVRYVAAEERARAALSTRERAENALRGLDRILDPDGVSAASRLSTQEESK